MAWENRKLGDVCRLINGRAYKKHEMLSEGPYPLLRVGNFFTNRGWYYSDMDLDPDKYCDDGDLLYAWSASFGPKIWDGGKVIYHYHIWKIEINEELIDKNYLYYLLDWDKEHIKSEQGAGTTMVHVTKGSMENRILPFPSLKEQKRIVAILDQAFADIDQARATAETNLKNARELFDSYLEQVFRQRGEGWVDKRLDSFCVFSSGGTPPKNNISYWSGSIPWISGRDMKSTQLFDSFLHISPSAIEESSTRIASIGSILVLVRGMGLAHGAQVAELMVPCAFNQDIKGLHPKSEIISRYLVLALRYHINLSEDILSSAAHGTLKINLEQLKEIVIPIPPKYQQERIVKKLNMLIENIICLENVYEKKLNKFSELKNSILQKAFTGELTKGKGIAA